MNTHQCFLWLLRTSWQASILAIVILAVQWAFQKRLSARWRYALWFLLIARLALPILPSSPISIFNLGHSHQTLVGSPGAINQAHPGMAAIPSQSSKKALPTEPLPAAQPTARESVRLQPAFSQYSPESSPGWNAWQVIAFIWLVGVVLFAARIVVHNVLFLRRLDTAAPITNTSVLSFVDACRAQMGIKSKIRLLEAASVKSPALHGLLRKTLLLPPGLIQQFTETEMRHIFLHELAHIKRNDMAALAVVTLCKIVHWFNPVLWLAFRRMSADRELACDEMALSYAGERQSGPYGETILKLLEICSNPAAAPGVIGILEERKLVRRRILMIASFGHQRRSSLPTIILAGVVGLVTLTNAQSNQPGPAPTATNVPPAESSGELGKAQAACQHAMAIYQHDQEIAHTDREQAAAAIFHLGEAYRQQNDSEKAKEQFQHIVDDFPDATGFYAKSQRYLLSLPNPPPDFLFSIDDVLYPGGVAADSAGNIYVSDTQRNRLDKFSSQGKPIKQWGQLGDGKGDFKYPQGLAIDSADKIYVADVENNRVQKFAADGTFVKEWGQRGSAPGQFNQPYNVAVDKDDNVYVVDSDNNRVQEFTSEGVYLRTFGSLGVGAGGLRNPQGVAVDLNGNVYVGDRPNDRVEKFSPDGTAQAGFDWPGVHDVAVDASGNVYLANADQSSVQEFSSNGVLLTEWGREGTALGQFKFLARISVDRSDRILITDAENNRVQVFGYSTAPDSK